MTSQPAYVPWEGESNRDTVIIAKLIAYTEIMFEGAKRTHQREGVSDLATRQFCYGLGTLVVLSRIDNLTVWEQSKVNQLTILRNELGSVLNA